MADNSMKWFAYHGKKYSSQIRKLTDKQRSDIMLAIDALFTSGELIQLDPVTDMAFSPIFDDYKESQSEMDKKSETNRNNVNKRWHKEKAPAKEEIRPHTTVYDRIPSNTNDTQYNTEHNNSEENNKEDNNKPTVEGGLQGGDKSQPFAIIPDGDYQAQTEAEFEERRNRALKAFGQ